MKKLKTIKNMIWHTYSMNVKKTEASQTIESQTAEIAKIMNENKAIINNTAKILNSVNYNQLPKNKFSIVIPAYNVEKYISKTIESIVFQSKNYFESVEIIIIDDGSTDETIEIAQKWAELYDNIFIYSQKNQGQAIARKNGLYRANYQHVTFIDADDYISSDYFDVVNLAIHKHPDAGMYLTRQVFYDEKNNRFREPGINKRYEFNGDTKWVDLFSEDNLITQTSGATVIFKRDLMLINELEFPNLKPVFEDAFFVNSYLLETNNTVAILVKNAKYYNRKRADESSTQNFAVYDTRKYVDLLNDGYLELLKKYYEKLNYIPKVIQRTILFDMLLQNEQFFDLNIKLTPEQKSTRKKYLRDIFELIDFDTIENYERFTIEEKIGYNLFYYSNQMDLKYDSSIFDYSQNYLKLLIIGGDISDFKIKISKNEYLATELEYKEVETYFHQKSGLKRWYIKIDLGMLINSTEITVINNEYKNTLKVDHKIFEYKNKDLDENSVFLFMDRKDKADDNAEVMYRYFKEETKFKKIYFVLEKNSDDWKRLEQEGFNLVQLFSKEYNNLYLRAAKIFSSGFDPYIENNRRYRHKKIAKVDFVFLQHGVITDDLSKFFKETRINKFIVSSELEKKCVLENSNLFDNEIIITGLARFDNLRSKNTRQILIAPTWRRNITKQGFSDFEETSFYINYSNLLSNKKLLNELEKNDFRIKFMLHPNFVAVADYFKKFENEHIQILTPLEIKYADLLRESDLLISDYSSLVFDFAKMKKPTILFQFDEKDFYDSHTYNKFYDYVDVKVGPKVETMENVIENINYFLNDIELKNLDYDYYLDYHDEKNSERIYKEIFEN